jgi:hypothetical protein
MSEYFTDDDVTKVAALLGDWFGHEGPTQRGDARDFLDEIAPAIAARAIEAEVPYGTAMYWQGYEDALRQAADEWTDDSPMAKGVAAWLYARAERMTNE